jgi:hypothetical protein
MAAIGRDPSSPLSERFSLDAVILGLAEDLASLRAGQISVEDARVRAELAKQLMNGVRLVINAQKFLERGARLVAPESSEQ